MALGLATALVFHIVSVKSITSNVDRYYGSNDAAFATIFCNSKTAEVMFVDSRYPDIDGKVFFFGSPAACEKSRKLVRESYKKCLTQLLLDTKTHGAVVQASHCK